MKSIGVFRFLAAGCFLASAVSATTIRNAATDFSTISNPTGVWSYGTSGTTLGGALALYTTTFSSSGVYVWGGAGSPLVGSNTNASTVMLSNSAFLQPGQLFAQPGPNGEYSVVRFTAPGTDFYQLFAAFTGVDFVGPTTTDVHVLLNGVSIFDGVVKRLPNRPVVLQRVGFERRRHSRFCRWLWIRQFVRPRLHRDCCHPDLQSQAVYLKSDAAAVSRAVVPIPPNPRQVE